MKSKSPPLAIEKRLRIESMRINFLALIPQTFCKPVTG
jgi:hypothetical protein